MHLTLPPSSHLYIGGMLMAFRVKIMRLSCEVYRSDECSLQNTHHAVRWLCPKSTCTERLIPASPSKSCLHQWSLSCESWTVSGVDPYVASMLAIFISNLLQCMVMSAFSTTVMLLSNPSLWLFSSISPLSLLLSLLTVVFLMGPSHACPYEERGLFHWFPGVGLLLVSLWCQLCGCLMIILSYLMAAMLGMLWWHY